MGLLLLYVHLMSLLELKVETVHSVDYSNLEQFVKQIYDRTIEIIALEEASNGDNLRMSVDGNLSTEEIQLFNKWVLGDPWALMFRTNILLNKLCADGHIPKGNYLIEVFW
jgi:hypothetical protein